jgi:hypothetical protein
MLRQPCSFFIGGLLFTTLRFYNAVFRVLHDTPMLARPIYFSFRRAFAGSASTWLYPVERVFFQRYLAKNCFFCSSLKAKPTREGLQCARLAASEKARQNSPNTCNQTARQKFNNCCKPTRRFGPDNLATNRQLREFHGDRSIANE